MAVSRFIERFASVLVEAGIPRMPARVFAALLAADSGKLTAAELAGQLQASPAAVSGGVRYLIGVGMVSREGEPGSRRHHYRVPDHVWDEVITGRDRLMARWTAVLKEGIALVGADTPAGAAPSCRAFSPGGRSTRPRSTAPRKRARRPPPDASLSSTAPTPRCWSGTTPSDPLSVGRPRRRHGDAPS